MTKHTKILGVDYDLIIMHNGSVLRTHGRRVCCGDVCAVHNTTQHHMITWAQTWRHDRKIMERVCPHGVGHPDPDDFRIRSGLDTGVHGCDSCCVMLS